MDEKNAAAILGRKGGANSRKFLSPEERTRLARKAAAASAKVRKAKAKKRKQAS